MKRLTLFTLILLFGSFSCYGLTSKEVKKEISEIRSLWFKGKLDESYKKSLVALKKARKLKNDTLIGLIHNEIGIIFDYKGDYSESVENYFKAQRIFQRLNDLDNLAYVYSNLGLIYYSSGDFNLSLKYQSKSLYLRKKINDLEGQSSSYNNIAIVYMGQKKFDKAIQYYRISLEMDKKTNNKIGVADSYNNIGVCYMDLNQLDSAIFYFEKAIKISKQISFSTNIQNATSNIATLYAKQHKNNLAKQYIDESLKISLKSGDKKNTAYCYKILTEIAVYEKDYKNAYLYSEKYYKIENKRIGETNLRQLASIEVKHKYEKEKEVEKEKLARSEAERKSNYIFLISTCIVLVFVLFMSFFLYRKWKQTNFQKQEIDLKNNLLKEQNLEIFQSINYAQRIQDALLPSSEKINSIFEKNSLLYLPKDIISGDFYWAFETKTHKYIAVADCTGHGVPGALMNMICHNALNRSILEFQCTMPGEILTKTREIIVAELSRKDENVNDGMDISLIAVDSKTNQLYWSGAHNDLWILRKHAQTIETLNALNQPIGKHIDYTDFETHEFNVESGDRLVLLTDGFGDQFGGPKNKKFKDSNLKKLLLNNFSLTLEENNQLLKKTFLEWKKDEPQIDDVCILLIEI